jgi:hypothetical protein
MFHSPFRYSAEQLFRAPFWPNGGITDEDTKSVDVAKVREVN